MENDIVLSASEVKAIVQTLKGIKPRGFKSMDRIVGLVMFFENKMSQEQQKQVVEVANNGTD